MKTGKLYLVLTLLFVGYVAVAQEIKQTIRGKVLDADTQQPLIGASVVVLNSDPFLGATTNYNGEFEINNVPVGRVSLAVSYMGYEQKLLPNMVLNSAKQLVITVELQESVVKMDEVEINGNEHKADINNEMAVTSARTISVDETSRFAGTFNDPARMASNFAGVTADAQGDNSIVVRGNSPKGIKWRLEGVEIPNPNHFSDEGATGGPINALNSSMLANSVFLTGAFAPEYGNAYSGVLDISLRNGNNQEREYSFSAGVLGLDLTAEGPFSRNYNGSYLINYRYSSLAILDNLNIVDFGGVPKYQDASFKFLLPTNKYGYFTLFGLWGISSIEDGAMDSVNGKPTEVFRSQYSANLATVGLKHALHLGRNAYVTSAISWSANGSGYTQQVRKEDASFLENYRDNLGKQSLRAQSIVDYKIDARNKLRAGFFYTQHYLDLYSAYYNEDNNKWIHDFNSKGNAGLAEGFVSWRYRATEKLTFVSGSHYSQFLLNQSQKLEPRASLRWEVAPATYFTLGYGRHSRIESLLTYFSSTTLANGSAYYPNKNLKMLNASHYVAGIERRFGANYNVKMEVYYQALGNVPVVNDVNSAISTINSYDSYTTQQMVNKGTGRNYGIELTAERYLNKGYYFMFTNSLYQSKYTALDGVERNTRWNGNYVSNLLVGKEWKLGAEQNKVLGLNGKISLIGGKRYTKILLDQSIATGTEVRDWQHIYETKGDDIFQANMSFYYRVNRQKTTHEFKIDVQNITNNAAVVNEYFNPITQKIEKGTQLALIPNIIYRIQF
ncbi:TonB-dependent receptor plug domain-containing protein [bacterium]|nr:TonB-dependent receptor plug domain-containing protein [bacterium]